MGVPVVVAESFAPLDVGSGPEDDVDRLEDAAEEVWAWRR